jgi:hypothetical protein
MTTSAGIISGALGHLGIRTAESPLTAAEVQDGLEDLNDMGAEWEESGLHMGFEPSLDVNATLNVPRSSISAFKSHLAIRIAPQYSRIVSPALAELARESMKSLEASLVFIGEVALPDTLPTGSGNYSGDLIGNRFFRQNKKERF